jgi:hypothetical protein
MIDPKLIEQGITATAYIQAQEEHTAALANYYLAGERLRQTEKRKEATLNAYLATQRGN